MIGNDFAISPIEEERALHIFAYYKFLSVLLELEKDEIPKIAQGRDPIPKYNPKTNTILLDVKDYKKPVVYPYLARMMYITKINAIRKKKNEDTLIDHQRAKDDSIAAFSFEVFIMENVFNNYDDISDVKKYINKEVLDKNILEFEKLFTTEKTEYALELTNFDAETSPVFIKNLYS